MTKIELNIKYRDTNRIIEMLVRSGCYLEPTGSGKVMKGDDHVGYLDTWSNELQIWDEKVKSSLNRQEFL